jgi:hypothetical protein
MPRTVRLPRALHGRAGAAAAVAAAAAILTGAAAGTAGAATVPHAGPAPMAASLAAASPLAPAATAAWTPGAAPAALLTPAPAATSAAAPAAAVPAARPAAAQHSTAAQAGAVTTADRHTAGPAARHTVTAARAAAAGHAARARAKPYLIYDSVTPANIPAHHEIATYADGGYAVPASQVAGKHVLWIDTNGSDPRAAALDVEPGDATPAGAAAWAKAKLTAHPRGTAIIYTMRSDWAAAQAAVDTLPGHMRDQVRWWIADPTGTPHIVPGAQATQWYWGPNYDITTATPGF